MISSEDKIFLKEHFEIDCDKYTEKEINNMLDNILQILEETIEDKNLNILKCMKNIVTNVYVDDNN